MVPLYNIGQSVKDSSGNVGTVVQIDASGTYASDVMYLVDYGDDGQGWSHEYALWPA